MPATIENAPSTSAYAPKRKTNTVKVMPGHMKASTPKRIAAIPRSTRAHQLLANTSNICFLLLFVGQHSCLSSVQIHQPLSQEDRPRMSVLLLMYKRRHRTVVNQIVCRR